ncbi:MAG: potassium channel family protein [Chloroflexi bacterium]|nr:potassium channel family protein [Chloroflexota bacterium]
MEQLRDRINGWFEKHEVPWELFMVAWAIIFVVLAFLPGHPIFKVIDVGISIFFVTEFCVRILAARSRSHYLLHHWMDLVALVPAIPGYQDNATAARLVRLLRLLMVLRLLGALDRITHHIRGVTAQPGLTYLIAIIIVMVFGAAAVNYFVERDIQNTLYDSYSSAVYWAIVTVTTTGYGDITPKTALGRSMSAMLMIGGLILWSLLTASVINYLSEIARSRRHHVDQALEELKGKLDRLDSLSPDELLSLKGAVAAIVDRRLEKGPLSSPGLATGSGGDSSRT